MIDLIKKNNEVFYTKKNLNFISQKHINFLKKKVDLTKNKRARICLHKDSSKLHEMIIILSKKTYIRPHKHVNKPESLHVIEGKADAIFFNDKGKILKKVEMKKNNKLNFLYRLTNSTFHCLIVKSKYFVFHESTIGPLNKKKTIYANWSPHNDDIAGIKLFKRNLIKYC